MLKVALATVESVSKLLLFIALGYMLRRTKKLPDNAGKVLSYLSAAVFCPAYTMRNIWRNFTVANITQNVRIMGYGLLFTLISIGVGLVLARLLTKQPGLERRSLAYAMSIPNYGYFGYPVVDGVFPWMRGAMMIFVVPLSIATNTYGYLLFSPDGKITWKRLATPLLISVALGMILGITGVPLQEGGYVDGILTTAGNCMSPVAMVLAGVVLGSFPLGKLLSSPRAYFLSLIRLLGIPALFGSVLWLCGARDMWLLLPLTVFAMPLGLNMVVYPESQGLDASDNARICCVSYILAVVLLPLIFGLLAAM